MDIPTIQKITEQFMKAKPANENNQGWGTVFSHQCEVLKSGDAYTASVIQDLIERGRA